MSFRRDFLNRHVLLELGPVAVFFAANWIWGLWVATGAVMAATLAAVALGLFLDGRVPVIAIASLVIVLLLGGASLVFADETFIKIRPTVGNSLFALALAAGLFFREGFLQRALGSRLRLSGDGWRVLTFCWIAVAVAAAGANEIARRALETDHWVTFKTALTPVCIILYVAITSAIARRYWQESVGDGQHPT